MIYLQAEPLYVVSAEEILWGGVLVAITMGIHGFGMLAVLRSTNILKHWLEKKWGILSGILPVIYASCAIMVVHLIEVMVWGSFFLWKGAFSNRSLSFYFSLNEYTTVGSKYGLPQNMRLLEGMIAVTGLLAFAWSTGVLFTLAKEFQDQWINVFKRHSKKEVPNLKSNKADGRDQDSFNR
jgi:hypothetical protein